MAGKERLVALDVGTTSVKGLLCDLGGRILDVAARSYTTYHRGALVAEQDPDEVLEAVVEVMRCLTESNRVKPGSVAAVAFAGILNSMLPVDVRGEPLCRALIWADKRSVPQSERLGGGGTPGVPGGGCGEDRTCLPGGEPGASFAKVVRERTGCSLHPMYFLPRLLWFKEEAPEIEKRTHKYLSIKDYIVRKLFGVLVADRSIASGTGVWNMRAMDWDEELLRIAGADRDRFPETVEPARLYGGLDAGYASRTGLAAGTPCVVGGADGPLAHLGSVGLSDAAMSMTIATGAALRRRTSVPAALMGEGAWCYYMAEGNWLLGGVIQDAGIVVKWFVDTLIRGVDDETNFALLNRFAGEVPPGAGGIVFFPFLGGERCPRENPRARGSLLGLSFDHTVKHLARGLLEGIAYRLLTVYRMLTSGRDLDLIVTGGVLKSPVWLRITSDFFGRELLIPEVREGSAWGAALVGYRALGVMSELGEVSRYLGLSGRVAPDEGNHRLYMAIADTYDRAYRDLARFYTV